jgi:hypothetical protein
MINSQRTKNSKHKPQKFCKINGVFTGIYGKYDEYIQCFYLGNVRLVIFEDGKHLIDCLEHEGKAVFFDGSNVTYYNTQNEKKEQDAKIQRRNRVRVTEKNGTRTNSNTQYHRKDDRR